MKYMLTDFLGGRALHAFGWKYGYYNRKNEQYRQTNPKLQTHHQEFQSLPCTLWQHKLTVFRDCGEF